MTYKCPYPDCNHTTTTISALTRHVKKHNDSKCPFCNRSFRNILIHAMRLAEAGCEKHAALWYCLSEKNGASRKMAIKFRDIALEYLSGKETVNEEMFRCPVPNCNYTTTTLWSLVQHVRKHDGDQCPICHGKYKNLTKHAQRVNDIEHASLYFLLTNRNGRRKSRAAQIKEEVMEYITVKVKA